jgi:two-component system sensor histidine kinase PilS (NtrC family)
MLDALADFDEDARDLMEIIVEEVDRLDRLIAEFLEYSRPSELAPEIVDLGHLVEDVVDLFENRDIARNLAVECRADPDVEDWRVEIDRESIRQVLWNLLNNAVDALDADETSRGEKPEIRIALSAAEAHGKQFYDVAVEDAGPGIDPEDADRLFEPFFTTKEEGTGLGLATSHRLVDKHGGQLQYAGDSPLGGATFVVRLLSEKPSAEELEHAPAGLGRETSAPSLATVEPSSPALESSKSS